MEPLIIVDAAGFLVDVVEPEKAVNLPEGFRIITKPWPDGMYKPKYIEATDEWVSGETSEEVAAREAEESKPIPIPLQEQIDELTLVLADIYANGV